MEFVKLSVGAVLITPHSLDWRAINSLKVLAQNPQPMTYRMTGADVRAIEIVTS